MNPMTGRRARADVHWTRVPEFSSGDIKALWEPSRFGWAFVLGRAYARTGDGRYAEAFWQLFEDWCEANPPNRGPQWRCGQEATFRLIAAVFGRRVFDGAASSTAARLARWRRFVYATATRIAANLSYALSQSTNHGISECVGLAAAARLLPQATESGRWLTRARTALDSQVTDLVYADGGFSQHSTTYHRLLLQVLAWHVAVERAAEEGPSAGVVHAGQRATRFLLALVDPATGLAPLCGSSDGSDVLPLASADYLDLRPVLQLASVIFTGSPVLSPGAWDEAAAWLTGGRASGPSPTPGPLVPVWTAPIAGWHMLRQPGTRLFLRAPAVFRHRPSQADLLHVDVWWRGHPVTHDPGTYSYNAADPFASAFRDTRVHNTVEVQSANQMQAVGRFLLLPWARGRIDVDQSGQQLMGEHDGYARFGVTHRRVARFDAGRAWVVEDTIRATHAKPVRVRVHWLLADREYELDVSAGHLDLTLGGEPYRVAWTAEGAVPVVTCVRADPLTDRGWWSPRYLQIQPAVSLALEFVAPAPLLIRTRFGPIAEKLWREALAAPASHRC